MRGGDAAHRGARRRSRQSGSRRRLRHSWHARAGRAGRRRAARGDAAGSRLRGHGAPPSTRRSGMIRVLIADDQMLVRQGIRTLLEMDREISVVGEAADGAEAIERVLASPVDVLLLDIRMPGEDGIAVLRGLSARNALPPTLILTTFDDSDVVLDGIRAGARGFLLKDVSYQQLLAAIRAVAGGATVFQPAITERLLRAGTAPHVDMEAPREPLTVREAEVVRLMAGGYSNREIAAALGTAEGRSRITSRAFSPSSACAIARAPCSRRLKPDCCALPTLRRPEGTGICVAAIPPRRAGTCG